jgi:sugar lactone lactonase YvrE
MSDFLGELREEVLQAHAAHAHRPARRRIAPRMLVAGAAVLACAFAAVVLLRSFGQPEPAGLHVAATVRVGGQPLGAAYLNGSLWIADYTGDRIVRVDARHGTVTDRIALPGPPTAIAAAPDGGLWARVEGRTGDATELVQIDPDGGRTSTLLRVGPDRPLAVGGGAVWAAVWATDDNRPPEGLYRVDAAEGSRRRIPLPSVWQLTAGGGTVWALRSNGTLVALEASSGRITARLPNVVPAGGTGAGAHALAADAAGAWVLHVPVAGAGTFVRVDPAGRVVRRLAAPASAAAVLASAGNDPWLVVRLPRSGGYRLERVDGRTGAVRAAIAVGPHRPVALVPAGDRIAVVAGDGTAVLVGGTGS